MYKLLKIKKAVACTIFCIGYSLFFGSTNVNAQSNLVPNYSFEDYTVCPTFSNSNTLLNWYSPSNKKNFGYVNACSPDASVPYNSGGYQYARTGNGYIGLFILNGINQNKRNYIQIKLVDSLKYYESYYVEYFVSLGNSQKYACNNISLLLTDTAARVDTFHFPAGVLPANAQVFGYGNPIITDTMNWVKVSAIYKAKGGEQYLTLGNFKYDNQTSYTQIQSTGYNGAGYYIDDVSVIPLDSFCLKADAGRDTTIKMNDSVYIGSYTNGIDTIKWFNAAGQIIDSTRPGFWVKPNATGSYMYVVEQTVNGCFSKDTVYVNVILPLNFLSFSISPSVGGVRGGWQTGNEVNVNHYNKQRSINAKDFTTIGTVKAKNKSYNAYEFIDDSPLTTADSKSVYYRIEAVDKDGKINYSTTQQINLSTTQPISIFPNPAKDVVNVTGSNIKEVRVLNYLGQQIATGTNLRNDGVIIGVKNFSKGLYMVQVVLTNGKVYNEKLVVE